MTNPQTTTSADFHAATKKLMKWNLGRRKKRETPRQKQIHQVLADHQQYMVGKCNKKQATIEQTCQKNSTCVQKHPTYIVWRYLYKEIIKSYVKDGAIPTNICANSDLSPNSNLFVAFNSEHLILPAIYISKVYTRFKAE